MKIRAATPEDAAAIAEIYGPYVSGSHISFEMEPPGPGEIRRRIDAGGGLYPWLAAEDDEGILLGYAYATAFRPRPAYRYTVETSVYVSAGAQGKGVGSELYGALLETLETQGFSQAVVAIALPNDASVALHERFGFAHAGTYRQVGFKNGRWWDVGLWQRPLAPAVIPPREPKLLAELSRTA